MSMLARWSSLPPAVRLFQAVYTFLTLNFFFPAWLYLLAPADAVARFESIGLLLGGGPYPWAAAELGWVWRILAGGNVLNLAFMCALLQWDLRRFYPVLWPLLFMKGFSTAANFAVFLATGYPAFLAVAVYDGLTVAAMRFFAARARAAC